MGEIVILDSYKVHFNRKQNNIVRSKVIINPFYKLTQDVTIKKTILYL